MGSLLAGLFGRFLGFKGSGLVTTTAVLISTFLSVIAFYEVALCGSHCTASLGSWFSCEMVDAGWGFHFDTRSRVQYIIDKEPILSTREALSSAREIWGFQGEVRLLREVNDLRPKACNAFEK